MLTVSTKTAPKQKGDKLNKHVVVTTETWNRLRGIAYDKNSKIKYVLEDMLSGKIDPRNGKQI